MRQLRNVAVLGSPELVAQLGVVARVRGAGDLGTGNKCELAQLRTLRPRGFGLATGQGTVDMFDGDERADERRLADILFDGIVVCVDDSEPLPASVIDRAAQLRARGAVAIVALVEHARDLCTTVQRLSEAGVTGPEAPAIATSLRDAYAWESSSDEPSDEQLSRWKVEIEAAFDRLVALVGAAPAHAGRSDPLQRFATIRGTVFRCRKCLVPLTPNLWPEDWNGREMPRIIPYGHPGLVVRGFYSVAPAGVELGLGGAFVVHPGALVNTQTNGRQVADCCGYRSDDGPNRDCKNGHAVASFWCGHSSGHFVGLSPEHVIATAACELTPAELAQLHALANEY